ncbi:MAG: WYL domain-containing protein, partial [Pirellulaceae bacterium]|nr:WYL domain-containing protein [Pirellulaceae bacterium]
SPYELIVNDSEWMVRGRSSLHRSIRTFQLDNILNVVFTSDEYEIPRNYKPAHAATPSLAISPEVHGGKYQD